MIELGSQVRDIITGWEGIATGRTEWLTGCVQYVVTPQTLDKDGKRREGEWFDEMRLDVLVAPLAPLVAARENRTADGGPQDIPTARMGG